MLQSVQRLDAPARATGFAAEDALVVAQGHPRVRGLRRVSDVLDLVDKGGQSPKETRLRLVLIDGGFTRPTTQMPLLRDDRYSWYFLDLGWRDRLLAVEYDGEHAWRDSLSILPAILAHGALMILVFALNMLGDGLRDATDPKLRGE